MPVESRCSWGSEGSRPSVGGLADGVVTVHIPRLTEPFADIERTIQIISRRLAPVKSIIVTGILHIDQPGPSETSEDLIIFSLPPSRAGTLSLSSRAEVLRKEVESDGRWLLNSPSSLPVLSNEVGDPGPRLLYCNDTSGRIRADANLNGNPLPKAILELLATAAADTGADCVVALGHAGKAGSSRAPEKRLARAASAFATELLLHVAENGLARTLEEMRETETVVPSYTLSSLPPFPMCTLPRYGHAALLVVPTANASKTELLRSIVAKQTPADVTLHVITITFDSGVGEQPYNDAGVLGARNRIANALAHLAEPENHEVLRAHNAGTVLVASIENFIRLAGANRPTDHGVVMVHNATTGEMAATLSSGVTVPPEYVERARRFGCAPGRPDHGNVSVGQVLAANVPGLDKADWHVVLAGRSRYEILREAAERLIVPW